MKKKRGKYIFLSILGILCIMVALNLSKIKFMLNMIKSYSEINKEEYEDLAGDNTSLETIENPLSEIIDEEDGIKSSTNVDNNTPKEESDNDMENNNEDKKIIDETSDKSYINIISDYNSKFELLQKDHEAKLDSLIKVGYDEYKSGELSTAKLASKYLNEGSSLENDCDANFNAMVKEMEKELKDNDHDTSVVKDLREYYNSYKRARRSQLMSKAKGYMD